MSPADVLRATADLFEANPEFWGTKWLVDRKTGCRCALGGIAWVIDPDDTDGDPRTLGPEQGRRLAGERAVNHLAAYLVAEGIADSDDLSRFHTVGDWNDAKGRTVHEVVGTLRAAARWAETRASA